MVLETLGLLPLGLLVGELENGLWEGELENGLLTWFAKAEGDQTWTNFKTYFTNAYTELSKV